MSRRGFESRSLVSFPSSRIIENGRLFIRQIRPSCARNFRNVSLDTALLIIVSITQLRKPSRNLKRSTRSRYLLLSPSRCRVENSKKRVRNIFFFRAAIRETIEWNNISKYTSVNVLATTLQPWPAYIVYERNTCFTMFRLFITYMQ